MYIQTSSDGNPWVAAQKNSEPKPGPLKPRGS